MAVYSYKTGKYTLELELAEFSAENYLLQSLLLEDTSNLNFEANLIGFQDETYHIPFTLAVTAKTESSISKYLNQLDNLRSSNYNLTRTKEYRSATTVESTPWVRKTVNKKDSSGVTITDSSGEPVKEKYYTLNTSNQQEDVNAALQDALEVTYEERKEKIESASDLDWHEKMVAHVDNWLNEGSKVMSTAANALDVADKAIDVVTKTGMFPVLGDTAHNITQGVKNAASEISTILSADTNTLAMYRWSKSSNKNLIKSEKPVDDKKLINKKPLEWEKQKDLEDNKLANRTLIGNETKTEKEYKGFINDTIGNIILQMDAFTHVYLSYLFTISEDKDGKNKTEVLYKGLLSENNNLYPYFFYMDEINFKPAKNQTVDLTYGAYKTKVQMQKPEGKNTFSFVVANDISLTLYRSVKDSSLGASDRGLAFATVQNTLASGVPINLAVIISSGVFKEDSKNCVRVQKFVLEDIKFSSINELPFSHKDGQSKSKIEGIYKRCLWYPNYKVGELA